MPTHVLRSVRMLKIPSTASHIPSFGHPNYGTHYSVNLQKPSKTDCRCQSGSRGIENGQIRSSSPTKLTASIKRGMRANKMNISYRQIKERRRKNAQSTMMVKHQGKSHFIRMLSTLKKKTIHAKTSTSQLVSINQCQIKI